MQNVLHLKMAVPGLWGPQIRLQTSTRLQKDPKVVLKENKLLIQNIFTFIFWKKQKHQLPS